MHNHRSRWLVVALLACAAGCSSPQMHNAVLPPAGAVNHPAGPAVVKFTEFTSGISPGASPHGLINGPTSIWFTEIGDDKIGKITSAGVVTEYPVTSGSAPNNIAFGADKDLWYTQASDTIGRMTQSGRVKNFKVGTSTSGPWDIALGTDGNIWFTRRAPDGSTYDNAIGRITHTGTITLFTAGLSSGDVALHDIALGSDGNMWFTEEFGNRVGFITPAGVITEYSAGISPSAGPTDLTAGPDGNVWFTEAAGNVARITPSGTVTEFPLGAPPAGITNFGNYLWVCENTLNQLARVDTSGNVTTYPLPGQGCGQDVALKSNLWITDPNGNGLIKGSGL